MDCSSLGLAIELHVRRYPLEVKVPRCPGLSLSSKEGLNNPFDLLWPLGRFMGDSSAGTRTRFFAVKARNPNPWTTEPRPTHSALFTTGITMVPPRTEQRSSFVFTSRGNGGGSNISHSLSRATRARSLWSAARPESGVPSSSNSPRCSSRKGRRAASPAQRSPRACGADPHRGLGAGRPPNGLQRHASAVRPPRDPRLCGCPDAGALGWSPGRPAALSPPRG